MHLTHTSYGHKSESQALSPDKYFNKYLILRYGYSQILK